MAGKTIKRADKISLVIADVDGTLVTKDKILTKRAQKAVKSLEEKGIIFAVTSGRPPRGMEMLIEPLALTTPIAAFNGGLFVKPDMSVIEEKTLDPDVAKQAVDLLLEREVDCWVYAGKDWFVRDPGAAHVEREQWTVKFEPTVTKDLYGQLKKAAKIVGISDDLEKLAAIEKEMRKLLGSNASAARSQPYYLDITHPQANKGFVVEYLSKTLKIPVEEIATLGDMPNDMNMFEKSGLAIAMGQASEEVKQGADEVSDSYEDEGFAKAIERFVLGE